jgi:hypothetical protein
MRIFHNAKFMPFANSSRNLSNQEKWLRSWARLEKWRNKAFLNVAANLALQQLEERWITRRAPIWQPVTARNAHNCSISHHQFAAR